MKKGPLFKRPIDPADAHIEMLEAEVDRLLTLNLELLSELKTFDRILRITSEMGSPDGVLSLQERATLASVEQRLANIYTTLATAMDRLRELERVIDAWTRLEV
jgi:hypothetical protein